MATATLILTGPPGTLDLTSVAHIRGWEGLLEPGPAGGELATFDHQAGGVWLPGQAPAYPMDVPITMIGTDYEANVAAFRALHEAWLNVQCVLERRTTVGAAVTAATCTAVMTGAQLAWNLGLIQKVDAVLLFQNLDGGWLAP